MIIFGQQDFYTLYTPSESRLRSRWVEPNRFSSSYATIAVTIEEWTVHIWFHSCPSCAHIFAYLLQGQMEPPLIVIWFALYLGLMRQKLGGGDKIQAPPALPSDTVKLPWVPVITQASSCCGGTGEPQGAIKVARTQWIDSAFLKSTQVLKRPWCWWGGILPAEGRPVGVKHVVCL